MLKKIMSVMMAGVMALCMFTACADNNGTASNETPDASSEAKDDSAQSLDAIKKAGVIKMFTNATFPPYEYRKGQDIVGVDVDVANEIAKDLGVKLEVTDIEFDSIIPAVQTGKASFGAAGMSITEDRLQQVDFSIEYATSRQYIITKADKKYSKFSELGGLKVGVQTGTTAHLIMQDEIEKGSLKDKSKESDIKPYKSALEAAQDLMMGRIDAVIIDKLPAENIVKANEGKGIAANELFNDDGSNTEEKYAICVEKGNKSLLEAINATLKRLLEEGKIDEFTTTHYEGGKVN